MKAKRFKAIMLVWVLLSQPLLSLAFASSSDGTTHDHSSHDHSSDEHNAVQVAAETHHVISSHSESAHDHHSSTKVMSTHDCGPCLNGDMSHCQCHAVMQIRHFRMFRIHSVFDPIGYYSSILAAHDQSLIRPPIFA